MASSSGLGIDGLASGLDTTSLINSLITLESQPQTLLKTKVTDTQSTITALQSLNQQVAALATTATSAKSATSLSVYSTTSSASNATATASTTASPGSFEITVGAVAQAKVGVSAAMTGWATDPASLTIVGADGTSKSITPASNSLDDIVSAVNSSGAGVKALKVAAGTDASGTQQYRLQFSSTATGVKGGFEVYSGTADDVSNGTATNLLTQSGAAVVKQAQDASVTLYAGTAAEQVITSSTNTFSDLLPGVSVTVSKASTDPTTITVARDTTAATSVASGLVSGINGVLALISTKSAVVNSTDSSGNNVVSGGPFTGDSTVRGVNQAIVSAASMPVDGKSPSSIGISITKDGTFDFDQDKFAQALADDPEGTQSMLAALATRVADASNTASDKYSGTITSVINGQQSIVTDLNKQVDEWTLRLTDRRTALEKQYSTLETQLSTLQSQSASLTSAIAGLPSYS